MDEFPPLRSTTWVKAGAFAAEAVAVVLALAGLAVYLAERVKDLRETATQQQRQLTSMEQRLGRLELQMEKQLTPRPAGGAGPFRLDGEAGARDSTAKEPGGRPELTLTRGEIEIVREYIKIPPVAAGPAATMNLGMSMAGQALIPLPQQLVDKLPKLAGGRFKADRDGSIVIVAGGSDRVGFVIPSH